MGIIAPALKKGGVIGVCAPSHVETEEGYAPILYHLRQRGFTLRVAENLYSNTDTYMGSVQERADDFNQLIHDDEVELILFGGGEAGNELFPYLDYEYLKNHPKRLCSYSDGTFILQAVHAKTGLVTYYGSAPGIFKDLRAYDWENFQSHVMGDASAHERNCEWKVITGGKAEGTVFGGYLRNVALMCGTEYLKWDKNHKYILFFEDHERFGDRAYFSAMLSLIEQSGLVNQATGVIFGHYSTNVYPELMARLERLGRQYGIPVVYTDDFGHGVNHAILDIGREAVLDAEAGTLIYR